MNLHNRITVYWDERSSAFNELRQTELHSKNATSWLQLLRGYLPMGNPLKILDIGTGTGFFSFLLAADGHQVTGIDASEQMIFYARENAKKYASTASFLTMDAENLQFEDSVFDIVLSRNLTWTLPHVQIAYREWHRVLKPGGTLLNFDSDYGNCSFSKNLRPDGIHCHIENRLLDECTQIKDQLLVSSQARPSWDIDLLNQTGFSLISCTEDISKVVHTDPQLQYEDIPLFSICAKK